MSSSFKEVVHELGFVEALPKPTKNELHDHYREKYYQQSSGSYSAEYTPQELSYFCNVARVAERVSSNLGLHRSLLDLGCGEGFFVAEFFRASWDVDCCDFSEHGLRTHNPNLLPFFQPGDLFEKINQYVESGSTFGLVNMQKVLEHVLDPVELLKTIKALLVPNNSCLRIRVPNDYSKFQEKLVENGFVSNTWFAPPEHLSYFNRASLVNILTYTGYTIKSLQADFPIELFLVNPNSNYWKDRQLGKGAHHTRVFCKNFLIDSDIDAYINYSEAAGQLGWGRELIVFASPS